MEMLEEVVCGPVSSTKSMLMVDSFTYYCLMVIDICNPEDLYCRVTWENNTKII
jgi:hypothetical protein